MPSEYILSLNGKAEAAEECRLAEPVAMRGREQVAGDLPLRDGCLLVVRQLHLLEYVSNSILVLYIVAQFVKTPESRFSDSVLLMLL